jgi:hypothetical protein
MVLAACSPAHDATPSDFCDRYVPGIARIEIASRFHELIVTTTRVKSSTVFR